MPWWPNGIEPNWTKRVWRSFEIDDQQLQIIKAKCDPRQFELSNLSLKYFRRHCFYPFEFNLRSM
ncbi:hypothetical protein KOR42_41540 [Thalassoglobus neptunius]|uniref:Uncharacterized protein n=1 Tax=Thalassoglobus neptunius TaxID=1938619 RepID=A0A5C5W8D7_9PLAN|nr:hypothetical protein KOR42_41540 [Thalassoglobus neptunius]